MDSDLDLTLRLEFDGKASSKMSVDNLSRNILENFLTDEEATTKRKIKQHFIVTRRGN